MRRGFLAGRLRTGVAPLEEHRLLQVHHRHVEKIDPAAVPGARRKRFYETASGASASMSVTASITTGRPAASERSSAGANSAGRSTRMPRAPMSSAMRAKFTLPNVHSSRACAVC